MNFTELSESKGSMHSYHWHYCVTLNSAKVILGGNYLNQNVTVDYDTSISDCMILIMPE